MECQPAPPLDQMSSSSSEDNNKETSSDSSDEEKEEAAKEEEQETSMSELSPYHDKNYFNSTMGGKDLQVLFAMAIGCNTRTPRSQGPTVFLGKGIPLQSLT